MHRYRELQNYLQICACTITVTEKQKWTQGLVRSTHTFIYDLSFYITSKDLIFSLRS